MAEFHARHEESITWAYDKIRNEIMAEDIIMGIDVEDEMQIEYYAYQYNPDKDYSKSISFIYQHLRLYLSKHLVFRKIFYLDEENDMNNAAVQDKQISSWIEEQELQTSNNDMMEQSETCAKSDYWTVDDVIQMSGLTKKQVKKRIKKKNMVILLLDSEVRKNFDKYMAKG